MQCDHVSLLQTAPGRKLLGDFLAKTSSIEQSKAGRPEMITERRAKDHWILVQASPLPEPHRDHLQIRALVVVLQPSLCERVAALPAQPPEVATCEPDEPVVRGGAVPNMDPAVHGRCANCPQKRE